MIEARLYGGPKDGEVMALPDARSDIQFAVFEPPAFGGPPNADMPERTTRYLKTRRLVAFDHEVWRYDWEEVAPNARTP